MCNAGLPALNPGIHDPQKASEQAVMKRRKERNQVKDWEDVDAYIYKWRQGPMQVYKTMPLLISPMQQHLSVNLE